MSGYIRTSERCIVLCVKKTSKREYGINQKRNVDRIVRRVKNNHVFRTRFENSSESNTQCPSYLNRWY